ncbi:MAG: hypothetical protein EOO40_09835, partial [Deltaproteobacteria bacterium]
MDAKPPVLASGPLFGRQALPKQSASVTQMGMHFSTEHLIEGIDCPTFERLFFAEDLNVAICQALRMQRELLSRDEHDGLLNRQVRIRPQRELPGPIQKVLGGQRVEYTETMRHRVGSRRGDWVIVPSVFADRVSAGGSVEFAPHPRGV